MSDGEHFRNKASHCRHLAKSLDDRTKASLEKLAVQYDEAAMRAELAITAPTGMPSPKGG